MMYNKRRTITYVACLALLVVLTLALPAATRDQGHRDTQGMDGSSVEGAYNAVQSSSVGDKVKIESAVDAYFKTKCEAIVRQEPRDFAFVIDHTDERGRSLYAYEWGRLRYSSACWQLTGTHSDAYTYQPVYEAISIIGTRATVKVRPMVGLLRKERNRTDMFDGGVHHLSLVETSGVWRLVADIYTDEFRAAHAYGTDWDELLRSLPSRYAAWLQEHTALQQEPLPRSGDGYRLYDRAGCRS